MSSGKNSACVVGGGIIGSWAALHLVEAGIETTLLEQFPLPHTRGSSHGASRAFRFLGDETMDRLFYSLERWQALESGTGQELFRRTGLLNFGPPGDPWLERHTQILRDAGQPCDWLDARDIRERFPLLRYPSGWGAAFDPNGGILFAHRCLSAVQHRFLQLGGHLVTGHASAIEPGGKSGLRIVFGNGSGGQTASLGCSQVIVAGGPWTSKLLPGLQGILRTLAIPVTYWRQHEGGHGTADGFPILFNARLKGVYGLPACEYPDLVKVLYHGGPEADPDARDVPGRENFIRLVGDYIREHLPGLDWRQPAIQETCMYTMTLDSEPVIDRLSDGIIVGCGFSGSGFKHAPATGRMLAALAMEREGELPAGFQAEKYRHGRFPPATN